MSLEVTGRLIKSETVINGKYKQQDFVLQMDNEVQGKIYSSYACFYLSEKAMHKINDFRIGDMVKVDFNIRGIKYNKEGRDNFFNKLEAWKITKA